MLLRESEQSMFRYFPPVITPTPSDPSLPPLAGLFASQEGHTPLPAHPTMPIICKTVMCYPDACVAQGIPSLLLCIPRGRGPF